MKIKFEPSSDKLHYNEWRNNKIIDEGTCSHQMMDLSVIKDIQFTGELVFVHTKDQRELRFWEEK